MCGSYEDYALACLQLPGFALQQFSVSDLGRSIARLGVSLVLFPIGVVWYTTLKVMSWIASAENPV